MSGSSESQRRQSWSKYFQTFPPFHELIKLYVKKHENVLKISKFNEILAGFLSTLLKLNFLAIAKN